MLFLGIVVGLLVQWLVLAVVAIAWVHLILRRLRYVRFGELWTGRRVPLGDYLRLPAYLVVDVCVGATTLLQYPSKR